MAVASAVLMGDQPRVGSCQPPPDKRDSDDRVLEGAAENVVALENAKAWLSET
jgi:hypothetical protein